MPPKPAPAPAPGSTTNQPKGQPSSTKLSDLDKSKDMGKGAKDQGKDAAKSMHEIENNQSMMSQDDLPSGNVREFILKHYGINAAEEKAKKEKRVGYWVT